MFTKDEQYTLMSLFLICRSPLMFGGNLPDNDEFTLNLITNEEALDVLQMSKNNKLLSDDGGKIVWTADDVKSNAKYVALFFTADQRPILDNLALWNSRLITYRAGEQSAEVKVRVGGAKKLYLVVTDGGDGNNWDHADWIEPQLLGTKGTVDLTDIPWTSASAGWGSVAVNTSVSGNRLVVDDKGYANGIGTHANSIIEFDVPDGYESFSSKVGLDKECVSHTEGATVRFHVFSQYPTGSPPQDSVLISLGTEQLGFKGTCKVRDLWAKKDMGGFRDEISFYVRKHSAKLLKIAEVR